MMLDFAGIVGGSFGVDPEFCEKTGNHGMAGVNFFGDFSSGIGKVQISILIDGDVAAVFEKSNRAADAGFGKSHMFHHVNGTHRAHCAGENKDGFKIHFAGFLYVHGNLIKIVRIISIIPRKC